MMKHSVKIWLQTILRAVLIALSTLLIIVILKHFDDLNFLDSLDGKVYDFVFKHFKTKLNPSEEIIIINADNPSDIINREVCCQLIEQLLYTGAKVIAFDILFEKTNQNKFEQQICLLSKTSGKVIHSFRVYGTYPINDSQLFKRTELAKFNALTPDMYHFQVDHAPLEFDDGRLQLPFDTLISVSNGLGHINFAADDDEVTRRFPMIIKYDRKYYLSLALQIVRKSLSISDDRIQIVLSDKNRSLRMVVSDQNDIKIPFDKHAQILINFIPEERCGNQIMPLNEALLISKNSDSNEFKDKIILIIKSIGARVDFSETSLSDRYPNWLIHASIISQILQGRYINESALMLLLFTLISVIVIVVWLLLIEIKIKYLKTKSWLVLLGSFFLLLIAATIMLNLGTWPGLITPCIALGTSYILTKISLRFFPKHQLNYMDFEIQVQQKIKSVYLVDVIDSPAGEAHEGEFKLDFKSFKKILLDLQSLTADRPHVRNFGRDLFDAIFQDQVKNRYYESLGIIHRSRHDRMRIKLRIESPEISRLPWEFLYDPQRRMHLALDTKISIARYPMIPRKAEPLEVEPPIKILVLVSSPSGYDVLNVEDEITKIKEELKKSKWHNKIKLEILNKTTVECIRKKIHNCHVIHYIGHGGFGVKQKEEIGALVFENDSGGSELIDAERFALMLCNTNVRLVILNACETAKTSTYDAFLGVAPALINVGIPAVIAMQFPMPDQSAIIFSEEFYRSLAKDYHVDAALTDTRIAMAERIGVDRIDWGIPVLFMRSPDGVLFRPKS